MNIQKQLIRFMKRMFYPWGEKRNPNTKTTEEEVKDIPIVVDKKYRIDTRTPRGKQLIKQVRRNRINRKLTRKMKQHSKAVGSSL